MSFIGRSWLGRDAGVICSSQIKALPPSASRRLPRPSPTPLRHTSSLTCLLPDSYLCSPSSAAHAACFLLSEREDTPK